MIRQREAIRRRAPLKKVNPERAAKAQAEAFGPQAKLCRDLPCAVCGKRAPSEPHHTRTRGAGGSDEHTIPLCLEHHAAIHRLGRKTFALKHQVDLARVAAVIHNSPQLAACIVGKPAYVVEQWQRLAAIEVAS